MGKSNTAFAELFFCQKCGIWRTWDVLADPTPHCPDCGKELLTRCPNIKCPGPYFDQSQGHFHNQCRQELEPYKAHAETKTLTRYMDAPPSRITTR